MVPILFEPRAPTLKSKIQTRSKRSYFELSTFKVGFLRPVYAREFNKRGFNTYFDCEKKTIRKTIKKNLKAEIELFVLGVRARLFVTEQRTKWGPYVCTYGEII